MHHIDHLDYRLNSAMIGSQSINGDKQMNKQTFNVSRLYLLGNEEVPYLVCVKIQATSLNRATYQANVIWQDASSITVEAC